MVRLDSSNASAHGEYMLRPAIMPRSDSLYRRSDSMLTMPAASTARGPKSGQRDSLPRSDATHVVSSTTASTQGPLPRSYWIWSTVLTSSSVSATVTNRPFSRPMVIPAYSAPGTQGGFNRTSQHLETGGVQRWVSASGNSRFVRCAARCGRQAGRRVRGERIGCVSGRRSAAGCRVRTRPCRGGVSAAVGGRWFRQAGGMPPIMLVPVSGRYLAFAEREEIAILHAQQVAVREIARRIDRSPSTISRELRRNASTRSHGTPYRARTAQWHAERRASRPTVAKLAANDALRDYVQQRLAGTIARVDGTSMAGPEVRWVGRRHGRRADRRWATSWSPEQIANRLPVDFPDDESMRSRTRPSTKPSTSRAPARCVVN